MLLQVPSSEFPEEKFCLLHTNTPEQTQTKGAGDGGDTLGPGRATGRQRTLVCTLWSSRWPWRCPGLGFGVLLCLGLSVRPKERHHGLRNYKFPQI